MKSTCRILGMTPKTRLAAWDLAGVVTSCFSFTLKQHPRLFALTHVLTLLELENWTEDSA